MIEINNNGEKKKFETLTDFLKYINITVKSLKYKFTKNEIKKEVSEKDIPGYLKHSSEQFVITYTVECLMHIEMVINNITKSPSNAIYDYSVNNALNIMIKERNRLLDLLEQSLGYIDTDKKLVGIRNGILEVKRELKNERVYKKGTDTTEKQALDNINDSFNKLDELEKTIDEVSKMLDNTKRWDPARGEAKKELSAVVEVYSPSTLLLTKSKKDELLEIEKKFLELDHMYDLAFNNFNAYSYNRVKKNSKDTPLEERRSFITLKDSFRNLRKAGRYLNKYRLKIYKKEQKEESELSNDLKVAQSVLGLSSSVISDLNGTKKVLNDNEKYMNLKEYDLVKNGLPSFHVHTLERLEEIKDMMDKGHSR